MTSCWIMSGDVRNRLADLKDGSANCCVTSPPYWGLRDYGIEDQIGLESTPDEYVAAMVEVFREVWRVLRDDGTLWLNLGDSYAGRKADRGTQRPIHGEMIQPVLDGRYPSLESKTGSLDRTPGLKNKDLVGIPWRVAFALQADGWYLRSDIIWAKPNPMPESVADRPTKAHEYVFLFSKSQKYYYDREAIAEPAIHAGKVVTLGAKSLSKGQATANSVAASGNGKADSVVVAPLKNARTVWTIVPKPYRGAHFATFPEELAKRCILAGCQEGGIVLDPFFGAGTTGLAAANNQRHSVGIELNLEYVKIAKERLACVEGINIETDAEEKQQIPGKVLDEA